MNNNDHIQFSERQAFPGWAYAVLGLCTAGAVGAAMLDPHAGSQAATTVSVLLAMGITANLLAMSTTVDDRFVYVTFGVLFPLYRRRIPRSEIQSALPETYSPLGEFGGWGIRGWGKNVALNARGNRGVRLTLTNGARILIGSQHAEELAAMLRPFQAGE